MFKIPDWEEDIPKTKVNFVKDLKISKKPRKRTKKPQEAIKDVPKVRNLHKTKLNGHSTSIIKKNNVNNQTSPATFKANGNPRENVKKRQHAKKHKLSESSIVATKKKKLSDSDRVEIQNYDTDKPDEMLLNAEKKKLNDKFHNDDSEEILFSNHETKLEINHRQSNKHKNNINKISNEVHTNPTFPQTRPKLNKKKELIKSLLEKENRRNSIVVSGNQLRERMLERLQAAQFRYLNEKLYTSSGSEAQMLFQSDPVAFQTYHQGYQQQMKKWPVNPLELIVKKIMKMPKTHLIADMGCGEAALSKRVPHKVRSFDLVAATDTVEACDMAHTPLLAASVDVAVYCLALMGTDLTQYLVEANRVLRVGGHLLIAEVESRFDDVEAFAREVQRLGFKLKELDKSHQVFFFLVFTKTQDPPVKKSKLPMLTLKPCLYKKR